MVFAASLPEAMYVCPLLLQPGGVTVEEAGLILGLGGSVGPALRGWLAESDGHAGSLTCLREVSAVSDWCVMASRSTALEHAPDEEAYKSGWHRIAHPIGMFERAIGTQFVCAAGGAAAVGIAPGRPGGGPGPADRRRVVLRFMSQINSARRPFSQSEFQPRWLRISVIAI